MSNEKRAPGGLGCIGDEILPNLWGNFYKPHIRIPIIPTSIQWKVPGVFSLLGDGLGRGFASVILLIVCSEIRQTHQVRLVVYPIVYRI